MSKKIIKKQISSEKTKIDSIIEITNSKTKAAKTKNLKIKDLKTESKITKHTDLISESEHLRTEHTIIGIDPGLHKMGVGIIKFSSERSNNTQILSRPEYIAHHLCLTKPKHSLEQRLHSLHHQLNEIIQEYKPNSMVIEEIFAGVNRNTIIKLSMARTIPILCAAEYSLNLTHLPTRTVKQTITGQGSAEKDLVAKQVCSLLSIDFIDNLDATDALACALCAMYQNH